MRMDCYIHWSYCFNPRTHIGCDIVAHFVFTNRMFQSTHPHRVRRSFQLLPLASRSFNPRTHIGCDNFSPNAATPLSVFQSTHPHRVRLHVLCLQVGYYTCFNPRTHIGCDCISSKRLNIRLQKYNFCEKYQNPKQ